MSDKIDSLWEEYGRLSLDDIPQAAETAGCQCLLDWFGVTLAGSRERLADVLRAEFAGQTGPTTVVGTMERAPAKIAAFINGSTGHALDFDDTNLVGGLHATASVLPAVLALAEASGASGAALLLAHIVGTEICCRLRQAVGDEHYRQGWHITSTLGIFGAAAGAGWLLGLDAAQFRAAIGLAASQVSGVHANFGTMTKPLHAGHAAERGLLSANLAKRGYTANVNAFERVMEQTAGHLEWGILDDLAGTWAVTDTLFKKYASGAGTQATIIATAHLIESGLTAADIVHAEVQTSASVPRSAYGVGVPKSGLELKFSLPGVMAMTILGEDLSDPAVFSDDRVQATDFLDLVARIELVGNPAIQEHGRLVVEAPSGVVVEELPNTRDSGTIDSRTELLTTKFSTLAEPVIGENCNPLRERLLHAGSVERVTEITGLTQADRR
jgi:2-methylcitrate dehydratase PrpD